MAQLGMQVHLVPLEFQAIMTRIFSSYDYEAAVLGLVSGDADSNPEINIWTSGGATHLWALTETHPTSDWQAKLTAPCFSKRRCSMTSSARRHTTAYRNWLHNMIP